MRPTVISIASEKGGTGKTTCTLNIGSALAELGKKVLLIDLDQQCNLTASCDLDGEHNGRTTISDLIYFNARSLNYDVKSSILHNSVLNLDYIPSHEFLDSVNQIIETSRQPSVVLRNIVYDPYMEKYDYIIFDNKTAIDVLTRNAFNASDYVIIPVEAGIYSFDGLPKLISKVEAVRDSTNASLSLMGLILNRVGNNSVSKSVAEIVRTRYESSVFNTVIPDRKKQVDGPVVRGMSCVNEKGNTLREVFIDIANEVISRDQVNKQEGK